MWNRLALVFLTLAPAALAQDPLTLWYKQPANLWVEALPIGNGHLGAMIFGRAAHERIQFNEQTVWNGEPHDYAHHGASQYLGQIRELLFAGKQKEAEDLAMKEFMSLPLRQRAYQAFGDLLLDFPGIAEDSVTGYRRDLNLDTAVSTVQFLSGGVLYRRELFASYPDNVIVVRLTANKPGSLSFTAALKSAHQGSQIAIQPDGVLAMTGAVEDSAIRFQASLAVDAQGGKRTEQDGKIAIEGADSATLILTGATNFVNYKDVSADPAKRSAAVLAAVRGKTFDALRSRHIADYQRLFRRVSIDFDATPGAELPTDERIKAFAKSGDPALVALLFQYGRYLMIGSSRPGGQPANLQGTWNESNNPPWDSKYTDNINTEMNYWPVEETNLSECQLPLFDALKDLAVSGAITAKEQYGARGWVLHHNFDLWRGTAPINASNHGIWETGGAWLCHAPVGALPVHRRQAVSARHCLSAHEGRGGVLRRCHGEGPANRLPDHRPQQLARTRRPGDGSDHGPPDRPHPLRRNHCRGRGRWASMPICATNWRKCARRSSPTRSASTAS